MLVIAAIIVITKYDFSNLLGMSTALHKYPEKTAKIKAQALVKLMTTTMAQTTLKKTTIKNRIVAHW